MIRKLEYIDANLTTAEKKRVQKIAKLFLSMTDEERRRLGHKIEKESAQSFIDQLEGSIYENPSLINDSKLIDLFRNKNTPRR